MIHIAFCVAPFVGVWIEITRSKYSYAVALVAPFVGVWIEIREYIKMVVKTRVAPFVGVWIEIMKVILTRNTQKSRSLRGSVD